MDAGKVVLMLLLYILVMVPLFGWLVLGATGSLGAFGETEGFRTVSFVLVGFTLLMVFVVMPFFVLPKLTGGPDTGQPLITEGLPAWGRVDSVARCDDLEMEVAGVPCVNVEMHVLIEDDRTGYSVELQSLVPTDMLHLTVAGVRLPLRVHRSDRQLIVVDWKRFRMSQKTSRSMSSSPLHQ